MALPPRTPDPRVVGRTTARHAAAPSWHALSGCARLRRIAAAHVGWCERLAAPVLVTLGREGQADDTRPADTSQAELQRIDAARWSESAGWPQVHLALAGVLAPMRLAPHRLWSELADPALQALERTLRLAIAAHLTGELRQALGIALHAAGLAEAPVAPALDEPPPGEASAAHGSAAQAALVLAMRLQPPGAAPCIAWIRLPAPLASLPPAPPAGGARGCDPPLKLGALVASAQVPRRALARLRPGSVVLLDAPGSEGGVMHAWLMAGRERVAKLFVAGARWPSPLAAGAGGGHAQPASITFARWATLHERRSADERRTDAPHALRPRTRTMDFPDLSRPAVATPAPARSAPDALADVAVEVQALVDLAPARLSELQHWTPGMVLAASVPVDGTQVALRVAGHVVGRGRLVAIDSLLGFELLELYD